MVIITTVIIMVMAMITTICAGIYILQSALSSITSLGTHGSDRKPRMHFSRVLWGPLLRKSVSNDDNAVHFYSALYFAKCPHVHARIWPSLWLLTGLIHQE